LVPIKYIETREREKKEKRKKKEEKEREKCDLKLVLDFWTRII